MYKAEKENERKERQDLAEIEARKNKEEQKEKIKINEQKVIYRQQEAEKTLGQRIETIQQNALASQKQQ